MIKVLKHKFLISFIVLLFASVASLFVFSAKSATVSAANDNLFVMDQGASICLTQDGLRFRVRMGKNVYDRITTNDAGDKVRLAFLIAPSYLFDAAESDDYYNSLSKKVVVNISDETKIYQVGEEYWANGCIGDLASESLTVKQMDYVFSAIACIIDSSEATTTYTYADFAGGSRENNTRSQYCVINAAALDPNHNYTERLTSTDEDVNPYAGWYGTNSYPVKIDTDAQYGQLIQLVDVQSKSFGTRVIAIKDSVDTTETPSAAPSGMVTSHYVSFYNGEDLVASNLVLDGGSVARPSTPTKASDTKYTYSFNKWVDGESEDVDLDDVTSSLSVYAAYNRTGQIYNVTFNYADGQSEVKTAQYGEGLLSSPSIFACGHTSEHGFIVEYSGSATVAKLDEIEENTTIYYRYRAYAMDYDYTEDEVYTDPASTAQKTQNSFIRSATTVSGDFEVSSTITATQEYWGKVGYAIEDANGKVAMFMVNAAGLAYRYGTNIDKYNTFTNAGHGSGTYWDYRVSGIFTGTISGHYISSATCDFKLAYNAATDKVTCLVGGTAKHVFDLSDNIAGVDFSTTCNVYFVTFNYNDTGDGNPARDTSEPHFKFSDMTISDDLTTYTITWKDGDDNTLKTDTVKLGEVPSYSGSTPTKTSTAQYSYTFNDTWNTTPAAAYANATYVAQFDSAVRSYTITFKDYDDSTIDTQSVEYGSTPEEPDVPVANLNGMAYEFSAWDKDIATVTGAATYTASRTTVTSYVSYNETTGKLETDAITSGNRRGGNQYAKLPYTTTYANGFTISATIGVNQAFWPMVGFTVADSRGYGVLISIDRGSVTFRSVSNAQGSTDNKSTDVNCNALNYYGTADKYCSISSASVKLEVKFANDVFYVFVQDKLVAVKNRTDLKTAKNEVALNTGSYNLYTSVYSVEDWKTANNNTSYVARTAGLAHFTWSDISFSDSFSPSNYTITWKNADGTTLETDTNVALGAVPTYDGATPTKATTAQYTYTFDGWNNTPVMAYEDTTYTATFASTVRSYTITFKDYDDSTVDTQSVEYGSTPVAPSMPMVAHNGLAYEFTSWDVTPVAVTGAATYTAVRNYVTSYVSYNSTSGKLETDAITSGNRRGGNQYAKLPYTTTYANGFTLSATIEVNQAYWPMVGFTVADSRGYGLLISIDRNSVTFRSVTDKHSSTGNLTTDVSCSALYYYGISGWNSVESATVKLEIKFADGVFYVFVQNNIAAVKSLSDLKSAMSNRTILDTGSYSLYASVYAVEDWKSNGSTYKARTAGLPHYTWSNISFSNSFSTDDEILMNWDASDSKGLAYNAVTGNVESYLHEQLPANQSAGNAAYYAKLPYTANSTDGFVIKTTIRAQQVNWPNLGIMIVDENKNGFVVGMGKGAFIFYHFADYTVDTQTYQSSGLFSAAMGFNDYGPRLADHNSTYANDSEAKNSPYDSTASLEVRFKDGALYAYAKEALVWNATISEINSKWGKTVFDPSATSFSFYLFTWNLKDWKTTANGYYARTADTPHVTFSDTTFSDSCTVTSNPTVTGRYGGGIGYSTVLSGITLPAAVGNSQETIFSIDAVFDTTGMTTQTYGLMLHTHGSLDNRVEVVLKMNSSTLWFYVRFNGTAAVSAAVSRTESPRHELSLQVTKRGMIVCYVDGSKKRDNTYAAYCGENVPTYADLSIIANNETAGQSPTNVLYYTTYVKP